MIDFFKGIFQQIYTDGVIGNFDRIKTLKLTPSFQLKLASSEYSFKRDYLAQNVHITKAAQAILLKNSDINIKQTLSQNPNLDTGIQYKLFVVGDRYINIELLNNQKVSAVIKLKILRQPQSLFYLSERSMIFKQIDLDINVQNILYQIVLNNKNLLPALVKNNHLDANIYVELYYNEQTKESFKNENPEMYNRMSAIEYNILKQNNLEFLKLDITKNAKILRTLMTKNNKQIQHDLFGL